MSNGWQSSGGPANAGRATAAAVTIVRPMIPGAQRMSSACVSMWCACRGSSGKAPHPIEDVVACSGSKTRRAAPSVNRQRVSCHPCCHCRHNCIDPRPSSSHQRSSISRRPACTPSRVTSSGGGTKAASRSNTRSRSASSTRWSRCHSVTASVALASARIVVSARDLIGRCGRVEVERGQRRLRTPATRSA